MTRRTLAQFRKNKGPDKWVAIKDEFDKFPSAPGDNMLLLVVLALFTLPALPLTLLTLD